MTDYYKTLGVERTSSPEEIKKAYRKLALEYHPDKPTGNETKFKEISEAYTVLSDSEKKRQYDAGGSSFNPFPDGFDPFSGFEDMFSHMFGSRTQKNRRSSSVHPNIDVGLEITIEELYCGTKKKIDFARQISCNTCGGLGAPAKKCTHCNGSGRSIHRSGMMTIQTSCTSCGGYGEVPDNTKPCSACSGRGASSQPISHTIDIPSGAGHLNQTVVLTVSGLGNRVGNIQGDVNLYISVKPNSLYRQDGLNLVYNQPVSFSDLCFGHSFSIPLPDKTSVPLTLPLGCDVHQSHKIKGKGFKQVNRSHQGDLIIELTLIVPSVLTNEQKDLLDALKKSGL